jgi:hypothetical protein
MRFDLPETNVAKEVFPVRLDHALIRPGLTFVTCCAELVAVESSSDMHEYLQFALDELGFDKPWKPVSRPALVAWLVFYAAFMAYAFSAHGGFLFIDSANLVVHEGGHNLFRWFGPTLCLCGGTLLQWLVPFLLAVYFFKERQISGFVFCSFFFFENWLYTATYMADARAMVLPLVTTGDPEFAEHDFHAIFSSLGILDYDTKIGMTVRLLGWCGMLAVVIWFARQKPSREGSGLLRAPDEEEAKFQEFLSRDSSRR